MLYLYVLIKLKYTQDLCGKEKFSAFKVVAAVFVLFVLSRPLEFVQFWHICVVVFVVGVVVAIEFAPIMIEDPVREGLCDKKEQKGGEDE